MKLVLHPLLAALSAACSFVLPPQAQAQTVQAAARTQHSARGSFQVQLKPQAEVDFAGTNAKLGRMSIDKTFDGELTGTSVGEMLSAVTATRGSAGYVAIERVTGTLQGRSGSFVLQHTGTMDRGNQSLVITVVPDSGAGDLIGLQGTFSIRIEGGKHFYQFDYSLPQLQK